MVTQRRLLSTVAAAVGGLAAAAYLPVAFAHADDCSHYECTLVSGGHPTDVLYQGFRPFFADWKDTQPVNVDVTQNGVTTIAGSYNVSEQDYENQFLDQAIYKFGNFTPAADNLTGINSDNLAGTQVYDFWTGPFGTDAAGDPTYGFNNLNIFYGNGAHTEITTVSGSYTNYLIGDGHATGDWIVYAGSSTPHMVWDSLPSSEFPTTYITDLFQNVLPPDDWFPLGNADLGASAAASVVTELGSLFDPGAAAGAASSLIP
ncbi:hypothetical protein GCM10009641_40200 [Mycobacterium cookii]|uniref:Uncharacterized protein n=1 Tax=Mycobacterium cookii TaxID=1775 RepID=A0A7I7KYB5_9MYCO|nr:hypothetical protein [Mycobacterium cookii]MCV7331536.1 hypothetical protein [Mycobacterium cookii]BBX46827.1 hypothetical protein MCOO_28420 [Mycobacterium cookii]